MNVVEYSSIQKSHTDVQQKIVDRCNEVFRKAEKLYGVNMSNIGIRFDLKGRSAGMAHSNPYVAQRFYIRFNREMLLNGGLEDALNDTVPHEIAHIVCFMKPSLGKNHDRGWKLVCMALGGTGGRTHDQETILGRGYTYEYVTTRGHKVRIGDTYHRRVRAGEVLHYRNGIGSLTTSSPYSIIGFRGKKFSSPIVKISVDEN